MLIREDVGERDKEWMHPSNVEVWIAVHFCLSIVSGILVYEANGTYHQFRYCEIMHIPALVTTDKQVAFFFVP